MSELAGESRMSDLLGNQPSPFAKVTIKRIMTQGVACPTGRPQHGESSALVDFGPNFADLSRVSDTESEKEVAKNNVELLGKIFFSLSITRANEIPLIDYRGTII